MMSDVHAIAKTRLAAAGGSVTGLIEGEAAASSSDGPDADQATLLGLDAAVAGVVGNSVAEGEAVSLFAIMEAAGLESSSNAVRPDRGFSLG